MRFHDDSYAYVMLREHARAMSRQPEPVKPMTFAEAAQWAGSEFRKLIDALRGRPRKCDYALCNYPAGTHVHAKGIILDGEYHEFARRPTTPFRDMVVNGDYPTLAEGGFVPNSHPIDLGDPHLIRDPDGSYRDIRGYRAPRWLQP
jgi:hypothetical protein